MSKGFIPIEILVVTAIIGLLLTALIGNLKTALPEQDYCKKYENYSQKDLPAKCLKYYR